MDLGSKSAIFFGHVNVGKSTFLGHTLKKMGFINDHDFDVLTEMATVNKKSRSVFAYILDITAEEQSTGNTMEYNVQCITYQNVKYTFYDTPGHRQFIKHFIDAVYAGASTGVLLVSAEPHEFQSSLTSGVVKEYSIICRCAGIRNLVVVINKMDKIEWGDYSAIQMTVEEIVKPIGYKAKYIVCNGFTGEGLTSRTKKYPNIPCLIEVLSSDQTRILSSDIYQTGSGFSFEKLVSQCDIRIKIFRQTFITAGWSGVCHFMITNGSGLGSGSGSGIEIVTVESVRDKTNLPTLFVKEGEAVLQIKFDTPVQLRNNDRIILRNGDETIAGGLVLL